jgi:hypothetical protein
VETLQNEVARLVRERQAAVKSDVTAEDAAEVRRQRDRLKEAVRNLQSASSVSSGESAALREQLGSLQAQVVLPLTHMTQATSSSRHPSYKQQTVHPFSLQHEL